MLTPESLFRVLNEFDGGSQVELDVLREEQEMTLTLELPADHERVLVDNDVSTAGAVKSPSAQKAEIFAVGGFTAPASHRECAAGVSESPATAREAAPAHANDQTGRPQSHG